MKKKLIAFIIAVIMLLSTHAGCIGSPKPITDPTTANPVTEAPTEAPTETPAQFPDGYDEHDYTVLRGFFEQKDDAGVTNGEKCFPAYDPDDPATWGNEDPNHYSVINRDEHGKVIRLNLFGMGDTPAELAGRLDIGALNLLEGTEMQNVVFEEIEINDLTVTGVKNNAQFSFPAVSGEARFIGGYVERLRLYSAAHSYCDITGDAESNIGELPSFRIDIKVEGEGYAGILAWSDENFYEVHLDARPAEGRTFIGWFDADGNLVSADSNYELFGESTGNIAEGAHAEFAFFARFE
ncbi:MAG: hypothetical protein IKO51_10490 [Clostridia bacterium]|nr:hypothetical protein [Clostridia bacterium]